MTVVLLEDNVGAVTREAVVAVVAVMIFGCRCHHRISVACHGIFAAPHRVLHTSHRMRVVERHGALRSCAAQHQISRVVLQLLAQGTRDTR